MEHMMIDRANGRAANQMRTVNLTRDVMKHMQKGGMAKMMRALGQLGGRFGGFGRR